MSRRRASSSVFRPAVWGPQHLNCLRAERCSFLMTREVTGPLRSSPGDPVILSSGHALDSSCAPCAELLAAHGFFVVGFYVKAYLSSVTSRDATLRTEEEPGDYRVLANVATKATGKKPILIGVSEGAGLSYLLRRTLKRRPPSRRHRPRTSVPQRARLAVEGNYDLPDSHRAR